VVASSDHRARNVAESLRSSVGPDRRNPQATPTPVAAQTRTGTA
jgi:hypothetical protein